MKKPREIFLSHSEKDRKFVDQLIVGLRADGHSVWCSESHLKGAVHWQEEIGKALKRCDWFIVVLSKNAANSEWVRREVGYALGKSKFTRKIVPVYFQSCDLEDLHWVLNQIHYVDFRKNFNVGLKELLRIWS